MSYVKANSILPEELIKEIQKYIQGETIYIPKTKASYQKWGTCSGARKSISERNLSIKKAYQNGYSVHDLMEEYYLSADTIKKIIYSR
ncbi:CD3324 family protein [Ornithinibacillus xuwenensis]|jgi:Mor family transcriptional regulator|uniref:CD3324 family protein n=1 Tax=Ornithinibacillus xuwenensis TaxID=3144668 RepID=A0ABU9XF79_9BACI